MAVAMLSSGCHRKNAVWLLQAAKAADNAAANETVPIEEYEEVTKTRKKTVRLPLTIGGPGLVMPGMGAEQLKVGCMRECIDVKAIASLQLFLAGVRRTLQIL